MNDARARLEGDEVGGDHAPNHVFEAAHVFGEQIERRVVREADEVAPLHLALHREVAELLGESVDEALGHDEAAPLARLDDGVVEARVHRRVHVRGQRPRGRRPHEKRQAPFTGRLAAERERDVDARVVDRTVPLPHLARAEGRAALGPPPDDLVTLVEQTLLEEIAERPPHALDVRAMIRDVRLIEVGPEGDPVGQRLPLSRVAEDGLDALLHEGLDAVLLDGRLAVEPELLLDLDLDGQPVRVPTGLARHRPAAHRLVTREEVLDRARQHVTVVRKAVGRGRPLVEYEGSVRRRLRERLLEDPALLPEAQDLVLFRRKVELGGNSREDRPSHGLDSLASKPARERRLVALIPRPRSSSCLPSLAAS